MKTNLLALAAAALLAGCTSAPTTLPNSTNTGVHLDRGNYRIVKAGARGESTGFVLFFIPFSMPSYADAQSNLYKSVGQTLEGRSIALANQTSDRADAWFVLFAVPKLVITADVIEFTDANR